MNDDRMQNIVFAVLTLMALVTVIANKGNLQLAPFVAMAALAALALVFPFAAFLVTIPIMLVIWMDNQKAIWGWWEVIKTKKWGA